MISLYDVLEASNGQMFGETAAQLFPRFCIDVNLVQESDLFVALKGDYGDSHQDMERAVAQGAKGLLCSQPPTFDTDGVSVIVVRNTADALLNWAKYILARTKAKIIVVTGTSERLVTSATLHTVLSSQHKVLQQPPRRYTDRFNVPLLLAALDADHEFIILELVADKPNELKLMLEIVQPDVTVIGDVGQSYLNNFESIEQLVQEHIPAVKALPSSGLAVLNYDRDHVRELATETAAHILTIGIDSFGADLLAYNVIIGPTRTGFDLRFSDKRFVGKWAPLLGKHQLYSVLASIAVGQHYEIPIEQALRAITSMEMLAGHMNTFIGHNNAIVIDDTYAANPDSVTAALQWLKAVKDDGTRAIFVLGDMDNLGQMSRLAHRQVGHLAAEIADVVITEGAQAAFAGRAAQDVAHGGQQVHITYSIKDALDVLKQSVQLREDDIVLVCGDTSARMEWLVKELLSDPADEALLPRQAEADRLVPSQPERPLRPSWVELDTDALAGNIRAIKARLSEEVTLMATVKADGYGHGAVTVSRIALQNGAQYLAVASISEALELRDAGIEAPILILSYAPVFATREALRHKLTITVYDLDMARAYDKAARELGGKLKIHVKVDSGMGRLGVLPEHAVTLFRNLLTMPNLEIEGIFTHFSVADEDRDYTAEQHKVFKDVIVPLRAAGIKFKYRHAANSAGILLGADYHLNMVRAGLIMYGYAPSNLEPLPTEIQPVLTWKSVIAQVKTLPAQHPVGYGNTYTTSKAEKVAVIPVGYADGFRRAPQVWKSVLVRGQHAPVIGRVSMEKTVISVDHIDGVAIGDEVVLLGKQGDAQISAEDIAEQLGTSTYEVLTTLLPRVPRR